MVQQNYFSDLYSAKILDLSAKLFFLWKYDKKMLRFCSYQIIAMLSRS